MSNDNFSGTPATLTGEEIYPQLYRTQDAAEMAGIKAAESRTARRIFLKFAGRLNFSPADERRGAKGGSPQKFWTREQIDVVAAEYAKKLPTVTLADRVRRIQKFSADAQKNFISIGFELIAAKAEMPHGNWANWLKDNFDWAQQTANYFMRIAERFCDESGKLKPRFQFRPSTLRAMLALPVGTEQEFIDEQAAANNPVENQSKQEVQAAVKQFKARKKISAPVIVGTPAQIDSPVIDVDATIGKQIVHTKITTNDTDDKQIVHTKITTNDTDDKQIIHTKITTNDTDAALDVVTKQFDSAEDSASGIEPAATATEDSAPIGKTDNVVRFQPLTLATSPRVIAPAADVQIDSASVNDIEPAQDSEPANGIDRVGSDNLRDVFKLILAVNDADKLRRIRDFADARLAALDEQKITPAKADEKNKSE